MTAKRIIYSFLAGVAACKYLDQKIIEKKNHYMERSQYDKSILERWLTLYDNGITIERYLKDSGYHKVVIYGLKNIGWHLYRQLRKTGIEIAGMDRADIHENYQMPVYKPGDNIGKIDLMIVTAFKYKDVYQSMKIYQDKMISFPALLDACEKYLYETVK